MTIFEVTNPLVQQAEINDTPSMFNNSSIQIMTITVFLLSFGIFMCLTNYTQLTEQYKSTLEKEMQSDLTALGPFKLQSSSH